MRVGIDVSMLPVKKIMEGLGVAERGRVQQFATERILFRMRPYMPYLTGAMEERQTQATSPTTIHVGAPYARYVYNGVSASGRPLEYTTTHHPKAGPHWDDALMKEEGALIAEELQDYVRSMK